jgi:predicted nucleotidyltransferase
MLSIKYHNLIKDIASARLPAGSKVFIFGSSASEKKFNDIDIGIIAPEKLDIKIIGRIKSDLEDSALPYDADVIDFNSVDSEFKNKILNEKIIWLI